MAAYRNLLSAFHSFDLTTIIDKLGEIVSYFSINIRLY